MRHWSSYALDAAAPRPPSPARHSNVTVVSDRDVIRKFVGRGGGGGSSGAAAPLAPNGVRACAGIDSRCAARSGRVPKVPVDVSGARWIIGTSPLLCRRTKVRWKERSDDSPRRARAVRASTRTPSAGGPPGGGGGRPTPVPWEAAAGPAGFCFCGRPICCLYSLYMFRLNSRCVFSSSDCGGMWNELVDGGRRMPIDGDPARFSFSSSSFRFLNFSFCASRRAPAGNRPLGRAGLEIRQKKSLRCSGASPLHAAHKETTPRLALRSLVPAQAARIANRSSCASARRSTTRTCEIAFDARSYDG